MIRKLHRWTPVSTLGLTALAVATLSSGCGVADGADPWLCPTCLGSVTATIAVDACPTITSYTIFPSRAPVGTQFDLRAVATDPDTRRLTFSWTVDVGVVVDPNAAHTTYRCAEPGRATLVLTASDGICDDAARDSIECTP
jgi:hypothetical protein